MMKLRRPDLYGQGFLADMEIQVYTQLKALGFAFILGFVLGLVYDLVRPARRRSSTWGERVLDILYALFSGSAVFLYVLAAPGGRLGVWELLFTLCGFLSYLHLLSDRVFTFTDKFFVVVIALFRRTKNFIKKILDMTKMYFQNVQK